MVASTNTGSVLRVFDGLVPEEVIEAYDRLLTADGCAKEKAEELVGSSAMVRALTDRGMAHMLPHSPARPAWLHPAAPDLALQGVLAGHQHRLVRDQELLLEGTRRLASVQALYGPHLKSGELPEHLVSVVSGREEISELSASLINTARRDWMTLETPDTEMPLTEDFAQPPPQGTGSLVRCRSIYDAAMMDDAVGLRIIRESVGAGEQARLLPGVPMKMKLADSAIAMLPLTPAGTGGALVVRAPVIIAALREYFEMLWARATPITAQRAAPPGDRLSRAQQQVLELMAEGLHDDAIARRAGISTTTVRRHITAIMARLSVASRFATGAAAQRRGWVG